MITAVEIENFKGIRERTRIEIKPITLLFGPNSAGKSTLLHALQLAREIFTRRNLDVDVTDGGAGFIDLGGFRNYVHGRDLTKSVTLRFDLDLSSTNFLTEYPIPEFEVPGLDRAAPYPRDVSVIGDEIMSGWVAVTVHWVSSKERPLLTDYTVGIDGEALARVSIHPNARGAWVESLNIHHPIVRWDTPTTSFGVFDELVPDVRNIPAWWYFDLADPIDRAAVLRKNERALLLRTGFDEGPAEWLLRRTGPLDYPKGDGDQEAPVHAILAACPDASRVRLWGAEFPLDQWTEAEAKACFPTMIWNEYIDRGASNDPLERVYNEEGGFELSESGCGALPDLDQGFQLIDSRTHQPWPATERPRQVLSQLLNRLLIVPGRVLRSALAELRYVGPARDAVPRSFSPPRFPDQRRWAGGLAAWEALARDPEELAAQTSEWLGGEDRLNTGYDIRVEQFRELPTDHALTGLIESGGLADNLDTDKLRKLLSDLPVRKRAVLVSQATRKSMQPADVGQGITQAVPVIVAALHPVVSGEKPRGGLVAIEQPELHLNPRQQAALGDVFLASALQSPRNLFILETHSEHLILRLQRRIREATARQDGSLSIRGQRKPTKKLPPSGERVPPDEPLNLDVRDIDIGVYYVRSTEGRTVFEFMQLDLTGDFVIPWPDDFFEIDFHERFGE